MSDIHKGRITKVTLEGPEATTTLTHPDHDRTVKIATPTATWFAPPIDDKVEDYRALAASAPLWVAEAMAALLAMVDSYLNRPAAAATTKKKGAKAAAAITAGTPHPSGRGMVVPLPPEEVARLDPVVPWEHELKMYAELFDGIDPVKDKALRDACFHLHWYGRELFLDREPLTMDKL